MRATRIGGNGTTKKRMRYFAESFGRRTKRRSLFSGCTAYGERVAPASVPSRGQSITVGTAGIRQ